MAKGFQPMLAATCSDINKLTLPKLASGKIDGIRCVIRDGQALSRKLKLIPNGFVRSCLSGLPDGLDGELIVGPLLSLDVMATTSSGVMSHDGEPEFTYHVFDVIGDAPFSERYARAAKIVEEYRFRGFRVALVEHQLITNHEQLEAYEADHVAAGYEGIMLRDPRGAYKFGRSTEREGGLLKVKRFHDSEAIVLGVVERMHNENEATIDERGYTKRSTAKAGKVGTDSLGALVCEWPDTGAQFEIGSGFTDAQRKEFWKQDLSGKIVKFKYQQASVDGVPRFPVFLGWRAD